MNLFRAASTVSLLTLASRITGLLRELLVASLFGASAMTDAFNVAFRIPNFFRRLFAEGAFSQAFVPVLATSKEQDGAEATQVLIDRVASVLSWVLLWVCLAGVVLAPALVWCLASGLKQDPHGFDVAVVLTRWMFPYIGFMSMVALASGVLNTWRHYAVPAATPVLLNLSMIGAAIWGAPWLQRQGLEPIYALAAGVMLGGVLQLAVQWRALRRLGLLPRLSWSGSRLRSAWANPRTRQILRLMAPALLGVSVAQISMLINTQIASHLATGSVSWITYADRLMEFPTAMLGVALGVVLMPQLAAANASADPERYSDLLDWGLRLVLLLALPCAVALLVFARPLVSVLYHYGAFSAHDVTQTSWALMGYGVGLLGLVAVKVLAPGFYARQDIRTPVRIAIWVLLFSQALNLVLVPWLSHAGLTLSMALGALLNALWLLLGLLRQGRYVPRPGWLRLALQIALACGLLGVYLDLASQQLAWAQLSAGLRVGQMALVLLGAAGLYFATLVLLRVPLRLIVRGR